MVRHNPEASKKRRNLAGLITRVIAEQLELGIAQTVDYRRLGTVTLLKGHAQKDASHLPYDISLTLVDRKPPASRRLVSLLVTGDDVESAIVPLEPLGSSPPDFNVTSLGEEDAGEWIRRITALRFSLNDTRLAALHFKQSPFGLTELEKLYYLDNPIPGI